MKTVYMLAALIPLISSCKDVTSSELPEIKPIKFNLSTLGGGNKQGKSPVANRYEDAYYALKSELLFLRQNLNGNSLAVKSSMEGILKYLEILKLLTAEPSSIAIQDYIEKYRIIYPAAISGRIDGSTMKKLENYENRVISQFAPSRVEMLTELPKSLPRGTTDTNINIADDQPFIPDSPLKENAEQSDTADKTTSNGVTTPNKKEEQDVADSETPFWILYKAFEQAHNDLISAYGTKSSTTVKSYGKLREILLLMKQRLPQKEHIRIKAYLDEYERIYTATAGFTNIPDSSSEKEILEELKRVGTAVLKQYNPEQ